MPHKTPTPAQIHATRKERRRRRLALKRAKAGNRRS